MSNFADPDLHRFDPADPVRYDFALYRIGQEGGCDIILSYGLVKIGAWNKFMI